MIWADLYVARKPVSQTPGRWLSLGRDPGPGEAGEQEEGRDPGPGEAGEQEEGCSCHCRDQVQRTESHTLIA